MKKTFASQRNRCYIIINTPATPLAPPCEEMMRTHGRFFIFDFPRGRCA